MKSQKLRLTPRQRRELQKRLKSCRSAKTYRRAVALLESDRGVPVSTIARQLGVDRRSVYRWIELYRHSPALRTLEIVRQPGRPTIWNETTSAQLLQLIQSTPEQWGLLAVEWTVGLLCGQMELLTGQRFSPDSVRRQLHRLNYVWKRPRYVLSPDPEREKKTPDPASPCQAACA